MHLATFSRVPRSICMEMCRESGLRRRPLVFPPGNVYGGFCCESADHQHDLAGTPAQCVMADADETLLRTAVDGPHRGRAKRTSSPSGSPVAYSRARERVRPATTVRFRYAFSVHASARR
jgi:hypothetical protein